MVRIQRLTEKIFYFHNGDQLEDEPPGTSETSSRATGLVALSIELDTLRSSLPSNLKSDCEIMSVEDTNYSDITNAMLLARSARLSLQ